MIRATLIVALCTLPFCGCGQVESLVADETAANSGDVAAAPSSDASSSEDQDVKTPLIRALLQTVDETKGESSEVKDSLRRTLRQADKDLAKVLGGNSKRLILQANKKPRRLVIGGTCKPPVKPKSERKPPKTPAEQPKKAPAEKGLEKTPADKPSKEDSSKTNDVRTAMVRALLDAVDEVEGQGEDTKKEMKRLLREADKELAKVLSGNSKRVITKANRKPPAPVVRQRNYSGVKVQEFRRAKPGATVPRK